MVLVTGRTVGEPHRDLPIGLKHSLLSWMFRASFNNLDISTGLAQCAKATVKPWLFRLL